MSGATATTRQRANASKAERRGRLVIVESPAKARTIGQYLGEGYRVKASLGHVRDLLRSKLSVDIENGFAPHYRVPNEKREVVKELKQAVAKAEEVYLATDPDREGEAIAWHLMAAAEIDEEQARRVVFHEITRPAVEEAFAHPRDINMQLVDAQQARRILDRLVGYKLSPLLWDKVRNRLTAGRVQSVAVRLIVEREREIENFVPEEYWTIDAELARQAERSDPHRQSFVVRLHRIRGKTFELKSEEEVRPILAELESAEYVVGEVKQGERRRKPFAPFITSTLQQEASRRLGFTAKRTMRIAQQLYEGINLGRGGQVGLITYMRTDSPQVSRQAQAEARAFIEQNYDPPYLPPKPPFYKARAKGAQEAHEAIRPTSVFRTPSAVKPHLSPEQHRLYSLIWQRFLASQMAAAIYDTARADVLAGPPGAPDAKRPYLFRASVSRLRFPGFLAVYEGANGEEEVTDEAVWRVLVRLIAGELLDLLRLLPEQHFTQPPPRYTEASLIKALEEYGIGRPSTYAPILNTIQQRGYIVREDKRLCPTETGIVVNDLLVEHFADIVDVGFTAKMEDDLDLIASGEREWVSVLHDFYGPFEQRLAEARKNIPRVDLEGEKVDHACPECGQELMVRWGRYGKFIGCSNYPTCRHTEPWLEKIGVACPQCGGEVVERKTRKGRIFYGCANYPACEWTSWKRPLPVPCPVCGGLLVVQNRGRAQCSQCEEQVAISEAEGAQREPLRGNQAN
jgi:DNA topoisomerase-1